MLDDDQDLTQQQADALDKALNSEPVKIKTRELPPRPQVPDDIKRVD